MARYGDVDPSEGDARGLLSDAQVARIREMRAAEQWERYDSIVIGEGATDRSRGWFDTWAEFANADQLTWFSGRETAAGQSYTNQTTERTDWAQDILSTHIEFISPPGLAELEENSNDAVNVPLLFTGLLPNQMMVRTVLADSDEISRAPASHYPAGYGLAYPFISGAAAPSVIGGSQGMPGVQNGWIWPDPISLAAKSKITMFGMLDTPIREMFAQLPGPGAKLIPAANGAPPIRLRNWYCIRITHRGPRYLQLRGARSSA